MGGKPCYQTPVFIPLNGSTQSVSGACENGSGNINGSVPGSWQATLPLVGGCGNGIGNQGEGGNGGSTACADGVSNAYSNTGGGSLNGSVSSYCTTGTNVTTTYNFTACDTGIGAGYDNKGEGCKNGSSVNSGCFTGGGLLN